LTQEEKLSLDRAMLLVSAGWFEEAQAELRILPEPVSPDEKAIRAKIWAAAKNFLAASKLANEAWDVKFELRSPELMKAVWPQEHKEFFESAAKIKNLDPVLTRSLTKARKRVLSEGSIKFKCAWAYADDPANGAGNCR
jgi:hypothetical protein